MNLLGHNPAQECRVEDAAGRITPVTEDDFLRQTAARMRAYGDVYVRTSPLSITLLHPARVSLGPSPTPAVPTCGYDCDGCRTP